MSVVKAPVPGGAEAPEATAVHPGPRYASAWRRLAAFALDLAIVFLLFLTAGVLLSVLLGPLVGVPGAATVAALAVLLWLVVDWLYRAVMESSARQGTIGKALLQILVTDAGGHRLSFRRASVRYLGRILSTMTALAGFAMIGITARKQGLHDLISGSLVVVRQQPPR